MQVVDTFSPVGWNSTAYFNNYMEAKKGMKFAVDAAHARGMIFRTVPNSVLRLAQLNEDILRQRRDAALPAGANEQAQKKFLRSQQRDATALMVRRMFKRVITTSDAEARQIENAPAVPANFYDGASSKLSFKELEVDDIRKLARAEEQKVPAGNRTWRNAPYSTLLQSQISLRSYNFNIGQPFPNAQNNQLGPNPPLYDLSHYLGIVPDYMRALVFPQGGFLRKDINLILAFSLSIDGKSYIPVGLCIYGTCQSEKESSRALPGGGFDTDVIHFLRRRLLDNQENQQDVNGVGFGILQLEDPGAWAQSNGGMPYYNQGAPDPARRGNNLLDANGNPVAFEDYNTGDKTLSELQNKVYQGNVAELYAIAAEDIISIDYDVRKEAAGGAPVAEPNTTLVGYGSLLMNFTICFIASERESRKLGGLGNQFKRWFPKYAAIVSELSPDYGAMTHAETSVRSALNIFPSTPASRVIELEARNAAKRGTQRIRNIARKLGFTSQPILVADVKNIVGKQVIPDFSQSSIGLDDTVLFPYVQIPNNPVVHLGGEIDYDTYVALYNPSQSNGAAHDETSDFIPLGKLLASIPKVLSAENGLAIDSNFQRICPDGRGRGSVMCM